jgi:diaminopimelate epimerase
MQQIAFVKMNGTGNDFVVLDNRKGGLPPLNWRKIADRHFGIGCDQIVVLEPSSAADIFMRIFNADGSESGACGNASHCVAWLVDGERAVASRTVQIQTMENILSAEVQGNQVTLDMGAPKLEWQDIPLARKQDTFHLPITSGALKDPVAVNMGNPHLVFFVKDGSRVPLPELGPQLENHQLFPQKTNVEIAQIVSNNTIRLRVWERGTGLTLACGTGACATLVAAHRRGLTGRKASIHLPGGVLSVEWRKSDDHVLMTGAVETSFTGVFDADENRP